MKIYGNRNWFLLIIIFLVVAPKYTIADEPPNYENYSKYSDNKKFVAHIISVSSDSLIPRYQQKWILKIYKIDKDSSLLWQTKFFHSGYDHGILSDDGEIFALVDFWFRNYDDQVIIYTQSETYRISASQLGLDIDDYTETVSHVVWRGKYCLEPNVMTDTTILKIYTLDQKKVEIEVNNGKHRIVDLRKFDFIDFLTKITILLLILFLGDYLLYRKIK